MNADGHDDRPEQSTAFARVLDALTPGEHNLTIVFTDIEGFSRMIERVEQAQGLHAAVLAKEMHDAVLRETLGAGYAYVKSLGDGCLFLYDGLNPPLQPLVNAQLAFDSFTKLRLRIGVHAGKVYIHPGSPLDKWGMNDPLGHSVNVAHRVMELAPPGTVYLSRPVYDASQPNLISNADLTPLGLRALPKLSSRLEIWQLRPRSFATDRERTDYLHTVLKVSLKAVLMPPIIPIVLAIAKYFRRNRSA